MKVVCIGSNLESLTALRGLVEAQCKVEALITLPPEKGHGTSDYVDLHPFCAEHDILTIDTENVNSERTIEQVARLVPDFLFTLGWSQLFSEKLINTFDGFVIGTHPSPLPFGRGRAPVPWTILEDRKKSAVTFFIIDQGIDSGKITRQYWFEIPKRAYARDVYNLVAEKLSQGFIEHYRMLEEGYKLETRTQDESNATHRSKRIKEDGWIDFKRSSMEVDRLVRAVSYPFPGAYTYYQNQRIVFWESKPENSLAYKGEIGQILKKDKMKNRVLIQTGDGIVWLGKPSSGLGNELASSEFNLGDKFGYRIEDEIHKINGILKRNNLC